MKMIKKTNGHNKAGDQAVYVSECGKVRAVRFVKSRSVAVKDGWRTVGRYTSTLRFYSVQVHSSVLSLDTNEWIEPYGPNMCDKLKDIPSKFEEMVKKHWTKIVFNKGTDNQHEAWYINDEEIKHENKPNQEVTTYKI